ncbi:DUF1707 domain-containing protein [Actinomadura syzygii]|uniref:DUF1707 domain-containing protein n=1 Tax=Actinomadura syzygii TaxID=1427538 RepID=A0A5D0UEX9_9ACTN|nr:DUF1707 domain-containing protein [Actinomadura syzygii]TYC16614.1 DUF1707 domain-containing protein [Actinomadura syzygii]
MESEPEPPTAHAHSHAQDQDQGRGQDHTYQRTSDLVRASDQDRDSTVQRLGDALSEGALDTVEHRRRLHRALTAATRGDLHRLTADLPESRAAHDRAETARRTAETEADKRAWLDEWGYWAGGAAIMTVIWAASAVHKGEWTFFWPVVPLGIWAAILVSYAIWPSHDDH